MTNTVNNNTTGVWSVVYNHPKYGVCLHQLVYGTYESAVKIAKECRADA